MIALSNWWATHSPFALERDLVHGPIQPRPVAAGIIAGSLLIVLVPFLVAAALRVLP